MNYRHIYHAGHFGDIFKHIVLIAVLQSLLQKDKPFSYVDTHAGIGFYDLTSREAQKTKEYEEGISLIIKDQSAKPQEIDQYLDIVRNMNESATLTSYPGSPAIVQALARPEDKLILTELHDTDYQTLKNNFRNDPRVGVHHLDGYQGLKAFLPPTPRRGLVLIDPSFEQKTEYETLLEQLPKAIARWPQATFLVWYPVKDRPKINFFHHKLTRKIKLPFIITELNLFPDDSPYALNGSGMVIVNPPWQLDKKLPPILNWLLKHLDKPKQGNTLLQRYNFELQ